MKKLITLLLLGTLVLTATACSNEEATSSESPSSYEEINNYNFTPSTVFTPEKATDGCGTWVGGLFLALNDDYTISLDSAEGYFSGTWEYYDDSSMYIISVINTHEYATNAVSVYHMYMTSETTAEVKEYSQTTGYTSGDPILVDRNLE